MQLKQLFTDDRAVSPVIGVILMVAITVILAAVIGTFVLGLGDSLQDTSPQASFGFDYANSPADGVTISHEGGDTIDNSSLDVNVDGSVATRNTGWGGDVSAGSSIVLTNDTSGDFTSTELNGGWAGQQIRLVWTSSDGSNSQTIASSTAPSN